MELNVSVNYYFEIHNAELFGGNGSIGYSSMKHEMIMAENANCPCENLFENMNENIKKMAASLNIAVTDIVSISEDVYKENAEDDEAITAMKPNVICFEMKEKWLPHLSAPSSDENAVEVRVEHGCFRATAATDPAYPGIYLEYISNEDDGKYPSRPTVLMEEDLSRTGHPRVLVWEKKQEEDYTKEITFD